MLCPIGLVGAGGGLSVVLPAIRLRRLLRGAGFSPAAIFRQSRGFITFFAPRWCRWNFFAGISKPGSMHGC
ncbi:MAG TPA: hypothetical protein VMD74_02335 [Candidatus Methylomirabilis sp.]|nr:hypothetical protein [Candidatus Methylomirabilis sp.]